MADQISRLKFVIDAENNTDSEFKKAESGLSGIVKQFSLTKIAAGLGGLAVLNFAKNMAQDAISAATGFQASMANLSTVIDTNKESLKGIGDQVLNMAKTFPQSAGELSDALYDIRGAGIAAEGQFQTLEASAKLAVAGLGSTKDAANLLTSALNAFQLDSKDANRVADIFFKTVNYGKTTVAELAQGFGQVAPVAKQLGVSLEELQAATAALTTTGVATSVAQTQIRAAMASLIKPTKEASDLFTKLHVKTFSELIIKSGGLVNAFEQMRQATAGNDEAFARAMGSVEGLGAALSLTGSNSATFKNTLAEMKGGAEQLDVAFKKQTSTYEAQSKILSNNLNVALIKLGSVALPIINKALTELVIPALQQFSAWIDKHQPQIDKFIEGIGKVASGVGKALGAFGANKNATPGYEDTGIIGDPAQDIGRVMDLFGAGKKVDVSGSATQNFITSARNNPLVNPFIGGKSAVVNNFTFNGDVIDRNTFMSQVQSTLNRSATLSSVAGK